MKRTTNKRFFFFIGVGLLCSLMIIGGSYAILKRTVWSEKKTEVVAGTLSIKYEDGKTINLNNTYPMNDTRGMTTPSYQFSVENTGTIKTRYEILLEEANKTNNTLDSSYLRYSIKKNEEDWSNPQNLESLVLDSNIELNVDEKNEYQLKIWLDEKAGNETQGKEFKARIVVNAIQDNENLQDVTPPVIKLKGDLSVNVEENSEYEDLGVESILDNKDSLNNDEINITYEYYNNEKTTEEDHVDTSKVGVHYIYYRISDKSGNEGLIVRSVNVYHKDTTPPEININGESLIAVEKDSEYVDEGAEAIDQEEGNLTSRIVTVGIVNNKKVGTYTIKYLITDQSGNTSSIVRVVNVVKTSSNVEGTITLDLTNKKTEQLTITGENLGTLSYQSKNEQIASVNESGLITANKIGTTTIIVTSTTGYKKEITIIIQKTVNITYTKQEESVSAIGKEQDSCAITVEGGSCSIELPTITPQEGYQEDGWYKENVKKGNPKENIEITTDESLEARAKELPKITLTEVDKVEGNNNWYKNLTIKATSGDERNFGKVYYCIAGKDETCNATNEIIKNNEGGYEVSLTGKKEEQKVCFKAYDEKNELSRTQCSNFYKIDGVEPTVTNIDATTTDYDVIVSITSNDAESGVAKYYYSKNGGNSYENSDQATFTFADLDPGDYIILGYVEDTAGNKSESKVTNVTVRSKGFCRDAKIDNFGDCIIATEADNTDVAVAKTTIENKPKPDFTKISPIITYTEQQSSATATVSYTAYMRIGTRYSFNAATGYFNIENHQLIDPTTIDYSSGEYYTCNGTAISCATIYKIIRATKTTTETGITYTITGYPYKKITLNYDDKDTGMYSAKDDDGTSYYYRGSVGGNYVKFANKYWRIIRVNGDGSVRMIYDGSKAYNNGEENDDRQVGKTSYNGLWADNSAIGYMTGDSNKFEVNSNGSPPINHGWGLSETTKYYYGDSYIYDQKTRQFKLSGNIINGTTDPDKVGYYTCWSTLKDGGCQRMDYILKYNSKISVQVKGITYSSKTIADATANKENSNIKAHIDLWYDKNLKIYEDRLAKDAIFCNNRTVSQYGNNIYTNEGYGYHITMYSRARFSSWEGSQIGNPQLTCENKNDRFSVTTEKGNGSLTNPIGLITSDEANMAGAKEGYANTLFYLYSGTEYWTMTPYEFNPELKAVMGKIEIDGNLTSNASLYNKGARPVINLKSDNLTFSGNGTKDDPYVIE